MKITRWSFGILALAVFAVAPTRAQQSATPASDSSAASADASKKTADDKPKRARVWDNDNIPKAGDEISVVGQTNAAAGSDAASNTGVGAPAIASSPDERKADKIASEPKEERDARLQAAKDKVDNLKKELDLLQRRIELDSQTYFSKPDYAADKDGAQKIKDEHDGIQTKQDEVDAAQKELDDLQAALSK